MVDKLSHMLLAILTISKTAAREIPYSMTCGAKTLSLVKWGSLLLIVSTSTTSLMKSWKGKNYTSSKRWDVILNQDYFIPKKNDILLQYQSKE